MEDLAKQLEELRDKASALATEIDELSKLEDPTEEQTARFEAALAEVEPLAEDIARKQEAHEACVRRDAKLAEVRAFAAKPQNREAGASFHVIREADDPYDLARMSAFAPPSEWRERSKRAIAENPNLDADHKEAIEEKRRAVQLGQGALGDPKVLFDQHILRTGNPAYVRAWAKKMTGNVEQIDREEADALRTVNIGSAAAGQTLTPDVFDPTLIITNVGTVNPFRQIAKVIPIVGANVWDGVSSAGVSMGYLAELTATTDNAPTFAAPSITCYKAGAFVPVSFEAYEDIATLQSIVVEMFADAKDRFEEAEFAEGSGSSAVWGIVDAVSQTAARINSHATNSVFTVTDLYSAYEHLDPRWRRNASWVMNLKYLDRIRRFGSDFHTETVRLVDGKPGTILGRPVYESYTMTGGLGTTTNNAIIYGDFSNYYIIDRIGSSVEFIPQLFSGTNTTTGFAPPVGGRGWLYHWRVGADSVNDSAFVLSRNPGA